MIIMCTAQVLHQQKGWDRGGRWCKRPTTCRMLCTWQLLGLAIKGPGNVVITFSGCNNFFNNSAKEYGGAFYMSHKLYCIYLHLNQQLQW